MKTGTGKNIGFPEQCAMMKCQSNETGYKLVANNCYFFDNVKRLRAKALINCASKFPSGGRFIEPRTNQLYELILKESMSYFDGTYVWLGVEYSNEKDAFIYSRDHSYITSALKGGGIG